MKYKAKVNFSGAISMYVGEVKEIVDVDIAKDLLKAGYIEEIKPADKNNAKVSTNKTDKKGDKA